MLAGHVDVGLERYAVTAARLASEGTANGTAMGVLGRFLAAFLRGDLAPMADELVAVDERANGAAAPLAVLALLDAGRDEQARALHRGMPPVPRDYYWLATTALWGHAAARLGDRAAAQAAYEQLLPWSGRVAGLDSGTLPVGPVDDALAACADLLGDPTSAARHREDAAQVRRQLGAALAALA